MSEAIKEISELDDDGRGDGGVRVKQRSFRKAKKVVLFPFAKAKKQFFHNRRKKQQQQENKTVSFASSVAAGAANGGAISGTNGCYFCFNQPHTLESPAESFTSDPNDSSFTHDMLRSLIEKNDFYSKECNPHIDY